ncbi:MAG: dihydrodipicolinate synthase family protein [Verrucomicrobiae bacterium]|nr:dihydrodipicolinate synthase family protein [Verrucomicrobiae bacterium]
MNTTRRYQGVTVPLVTPVTARGELDEEALDRLLDFQLRAGVDGVFVLGTTGEGPSLARPQRVRMVEQTVARVAGKALVYAGIGDNSLAEAVGLADQFFAAGANVMVAFPPAYYPLTPAEIRHWFERLLDAVSGPLLIYNIPATTHVSIPLEILPALLGHPKLVGIKDSEPDPVRLEKLLRQFGDVAGFSIFIGVGSFMGQGLELGASGIVPSAGNLVPEVCREMCRSAARQDWAAVRRLAEQAHQVAQLYQRNRTLGQSLAALKAALAELGMCQPHMLPPLLECSAEERAGIRAAMERLGLLRARA